MRIYIVIPAHNEEATIAQTLQSLTSQTVLPQKLVIVDDNSTDTTATIINKYVSSYDWIDSIHVKSEDQHLPGSKVVSAFYKGYEKLDMNFDIICKFDADLIFPNNYLESIISIFKTNESVGIAGGLLYVRKDKGWVYEDIASKTHVRGPIKAYRKSCFESIGGLKSCIGWDTIDVLLATYHGWEVLTDKTLIVSHLKPTGKHYDKKAKLLTGERWYNLRYGLLLTLIASIKSAIKANNTALIYNSILGYIKAKRSGKTPAVTKEEGQYIRNLRWKGIYKKLF